MSTEMLELPSSDAEHISCLLLYVDGMVSPRNEHAIESALSKLPGVKAIASFASHSLKVEFDRRTCALPEIARQLDKLGLRLHTTKPATSEIELGAHSMLRKWIDKGIEHRQLTMAIIGALCLLGAWITHYVEGPALLRYALVSACFILAGWYTAIDTFLILKRLAFDIDVLMFAAAIGAAAIGNFEEGGLLLVLFAFGGAGEELAMDKARRAIEALAKLAPDTATVRDANGFEKLVRVENLKVGDRVVVRPFDRLPADGVVESGASAVDQSPITGESEPIEKSPGSNVFAGTINGEGLLVVSVTKLASESTLAKIVTMVREAQTQKSPTELFTEKVEKWYVPLVLIGTAALIVLPPLLGLHHRQLDKGSWAGWFYQAMAFLTAASPCALAIGTPAAVLSGIARAARIGVLVKGGMHLESLGRITAVAFDKTGTLTRGRPEVTDIITLDSLDDHQLLRLAGAVEKGSTHPLARAIVDEATHRSIDLPIADQSVQTPGVGITAIVDRQKVEVGSIDLLKSLNGSADQIRARIDALNHQGKTAVVVVVESRPAGIIAMADRPRDGAADVIDLLKKIGIRQTIMLTGDRRAVANEVGKSIHVDQVHAELLPQDKLALVKSLRQQYGEIAMVGDGVNDAPALASATVGIAMGGAGTDVAIETADIALMSDDLRKLPDAISLSRFSRKIIGQNLFIALGVIAVLAPLSAMGFTYLGVAVLFHEGSTVVVVLNSLRLLMFKPKRV